jgi:capsule polysaccharide export protein KpsE/RkpR
MKTNLMIIVLCWNSFVAVDRLVIQSEIAQRAPKNSKLFIKDNLSQRN